MIFIAKEKSDKDRNLVPMKRLLKILLNIKCTTIESFKFDELSQSLTIRPLLQKQCDEPKPSEAKVVKGTKYALLKNPEDLTESQQAKLEIIARADGVLFRAYRLKEDLRSIFKMNIDEAITALDSWLCWASRCRIEGFVALSKKIRRHKEAILQAIDQGISNARIESMNNKIKLTVRMSYGFRNIDNLIALVYLRCSSLPITLPGRAPLAA